jgi:uncharacterized sulfatase
MSCPATRAQSWAASARDALTAYRDGIKSVHDQTLEGMKKGDRPDELVAREAAAALRREASLAGHYGTVEWSVRDLQRPPGVVRRQRHAPVSNAEMERAQRIVALAGALAANAVTRHGGAGQGEFRWAAELTDFVLAVDAANLDARRLKAQALTALGERQTSANARNYYLSVAQYLLRDLPPQ